MHSPAKMTAADARVAWPHRGTSMLGVNQRSLKAEAVLNTSRPAELASTCDGTGNSITQLHTVGVRPWSTSNSHGFVVKATRSGSVHDPNVQMWNCSAFNCCHPPGRPRLSQGSARVTGKSTTELDAPAL